MAAEEELGAAGVDVDAVEADVVAVDAAAAGLASIGEDGDGVAILRFHFVEEDAGAGASEIG